MRVGKGTAEHLVKFVKVKRPLAELVPGDPKTAALDRWNTIRRHTERIKRAGRKDRKTRPWELSRKKTKTSVSVSAAKANCATKLRRKGEQQSGAYTCGRGNPV